MLMQSSFRWPLCFTLNSYTEMWVTAPKPVCVCVYKSLKTKSISHPFCLLTVSINKTEGQSNQLKM